MYLEAKTLSTTGIVALVIFLAAIAAIAITVMIYFRLRHTWKEEHEAFQLQRSKKSRLRFFNNYLYIIVFFVEIVVLILGLAFFIGDLM